MTIQDFKINIEDLEIQISTILEKTKIEENYDKRQKLLSILIQKKEQLSIFKKEMERIKRNKRRKIKKR